VEGPESPGAGDSAESRRDEGAVAALVLAVAGYLALPVIPAVMAIWIGLAARRRIAATPGLRGRWMADAAILLAVVELAAAVALVVIMVRDPLLLPGS
jgi:hypothetical protein